MVSRSLNSKEQKPAYISNLESAVREKDKRNSEELVQEYTRYFLVNEPSPGIEVELQMSKDYLNTAKLQDINALSAQYILDKNRDIDHYGAAKRQRLAACGSHCEWMDQCSCR